MTAAAIKADGPADTEVFRRGAIRRAGLASARYDPRPSARYAIAQIAHRRVTAAAHPQATATASAPL
jgi:hypothetical protein